MLNLNKGEKVRMIIRPHLLMFVSEIVFVLLIALIPLFLYNNTSLFDRLGLNTSTHSTLLISMYSLWLLGCFTFLFLVWVDYYLDMWLITDGRVINVAQGGVISRQVLSIS